ncbi:hypothetical protein ACF3DV_23655 [Chlorogloeopsis fritschii PCC 9212]
MNSNDFLISAITIVSALLTAIFTTNRRGASAIWGFPKWSNWRWALPVKAYVISILNSGEQCPPYRKLLYGV